MADKKHVFETEMMTLLPLHLELSDALVPDPDKPYHIAQKQQQQDPEMESKVKRLIAHLENGK